MFSLFGEKGRERDGDAEKEVKERERRLERKSLFKPGNFPALRERKDRTKDDEMLFGEDIRLSSIRLVRGPLRSVLRAAGVLSPRRRAEARDDSCHWTSPSLQSPFQLHPACFTSVLGDEDGLYPSAVVCLSCPSISACLRHLGSSRVNRRLAWLNTVRHI